MQNFLDSLFPNSIYYYNTLLDKSYNSLDELSQDECKLIIKVLKKNGLFMKTSINTRNYTLEDIEIGDGYGIYNQHNLYKNSNMNIIIFDNLMILDYDNITYDEVRNILGEVDETFMIYKTYNGYHAYCVSTAYGHKNYRTLQLMYDLKCDQVYISFCYEYGYCVRLSKKINRDEKFVEEFVSIIGTKPEDKDLVSLVNIKDHNLSKPCQSLISA